MAKRIGFGIVVSVLLASFCIIGQAIASDTVGSFDWELSNVVDMQSKPVQLDQPVLSLDVDLGFAFLDCYGALCANSGIDCTPVTGGGFLDSTASGLTVKMDIRAGTKIYRISLSAETLGGAFSVYDKDGNIEYVGSIDLMQSY